MPWTSPWYLPGFAIFVTDRAFGSGLEAARPTAQPLPSFDLPPIPVADDFFLFSDGFAMSCRTGASQSSDRVVPGGTRNLRRLLMLRVLPRYLPGFVISVTDRAFGSGLEAARPTVQPLPSFDLPPIPVADDFFLFSDGFAMSCRTGASQSSDRVVPGGTRNLRRLLMLWVLPWYLPGLAIFVTDRASGSGLEAARPTVQPLPSFDLPPIPVADDFFLFSDGFAMSCRTGASQSSDRVVPGGTRNLRRLLMLRVLPRYLPGFVISVTDRAFGSGLEAARPTVQPLPSFDLPPIPVADDFFLFSDGFAMSCRTGSS